MPPVRPFEVPAVLLRRAFESRPLVVGPEDYDVIGKDGEVIGRIVRTATSPAGKPWMWSIATRRDGEGPVLGYEATRYAATEAFAKSWRPGEKGTVQVLGHPAEPQGTLGVPRSGILGRPIKT